MTRITRLTTLAASLLLALWAGLALAHGGTSVAVQQLTPNPGQDITVTGESLGANSQVEVVLTGNGQRVDLGEGQADETGDFTAKLTLPADLPPGTYQLQATGAESATTQITVVGGAGSGSSSNAEAATVLRERPLGQSVLLVAIFGVLAGLGLVFGLWRRPRRSAAES